METPPAVAPQHLDDIAEYEITRNKAQGVPTADDVMAILVQYIAPANEWRVQAALDRLYSREC